MTTNTNAIETSLASYSATTLEELLQLLSLEYEDAMGEDDYSDMEAEATRWYLAKNTISIEPVGLGRKHQGPMVLTYQSDLVGTRYGIGAEENHGLELCLTQHDDPYTAPREDEDYVCLCACLHVNGMAIVREVKTARAQLGEALAFIQASFANASELR